MRFFRPITRKQLVKSVLVFLGITLGATALTAYQLHQEASSTASPPPKNFIAQAEISPEPATSSQAGMVLSTSDGSLNFVSNRNSWSNGGVVVLSASKTPEISVNSYSVNGTGHFKLYKVSRDDLINYLLYKKDTTSNYSSGIHKVYQLDRSKITLQTSFNHEIVSVANQENKTILPLPLEGTGVWFLEGQVNDTQVESMIVRSNLGAIVHQGDNQNIFWVQDSNYASVSEAHLQLVNAENSVSNLGEVVTDGSGLATASVNGALDFAVVTKGEDFTLLPVNLENLNYRLASSNIFSSLFAQRQASTEAFMFTDRFLYKPGDTAHFKIIVRRDDDADYTNSPRSLTVTLGDSEKPFWQRTLPVSELGTVDGTIPIPADAKASEYGLTVKDGDEYITDVTIQIAQFRKPDSQVTISTEQLLYLPGETFTAQLTGENFLGQPIRNQPVRYKVYQSRASLAGDYLSLKFAERVDGFQPSNTPISEGTAQLDHKGTARLELPVKNTTGYRQFWTIHIEYLDAGGTATNDAIQVLVQPGNFVIERVENNQQYFFGKETTVPFKLSKNKADAKINQVKIQAKLLLDKGTEKTVEQNNLQTTTDGSGKAGLTFTPQQKNSYLLELTATDDSGNLIKAEENFYADDPSNSSNQPVNIFTVKTDKENYTFGETAKVTVQTRPEIKNAFISLGRSYSRSHRVVTLTNGSGTFDIPIVEKYQPNFFIYIGSFLGDDWKAQEIKVPVKTDDKKVTVSIASAQKAYGPGETASFAITATDATGKPVKTDLAFWVFDKALLELHGTYFTGIFQKFWSDRWFSIPTNYSFQGITSNSAEGGGGCFVGETLVTMADGKQKRIDQIQAGEAVTTYSSLDTKELVEAKVLTTHTVNVAGYLIINGTLKVTPEHKLLVNGQWKTAGEIAIGDQLLTDQKTPLAVTSIEWVRGKVPVYNLQIEKFHTFFANDIYVHNDKGGARSVFKDTAYWNPHVQTDDAGQAQVTVVLPDNLTTWVAAAVSANLNTQVGDGQTEFKVSKDIVARPILPQFVRVGDEINVSALLHNFTTTAEKFTTKASFSAGELSNVDQSVNVSAQNFVELVWPLKVTQPAPEGLFTFKAQSSLRPKATDEIKEKIPVYEYGTWQTNYQKLTGSGQLALQTTTGTDPQRAKATLVLKASRYPQLKSGLDTLLSRANTGNPEYASGALIAASIITEHGKELGLNYSPATLAKAVKEAEAALKNTQAGNNLWMRDENTIDTDRTRFAIEALATAQKAGFAIDQEMLNGAVAGFANAKFSLWPEQVNQQYALSLFASKDLPKTKLELQNPADASSVAKAILANVRQGFTDSAKAESLLLASAQENDTALWWSYVPPQQSAQWPNISLPTHWSALALLQTGSSSDKAAKALDYLYRNVDTDSETLALEALATVQYELKTQQLAPNYSYRVLVNGQIKQEGKVTQALQQLPPLELGTQAFVPTAQIQVEQTGTGKLFSQLETTEFYTDRQLSAQTHHLALTRKYLSTKKAGEPTQPGDLVIVQFELSGLGGGEQAIEIEDYLPSGLVAIDQSLDNGNFDPNGKDSTYTSQEIIPQGMKMTFSRLFSDTGTYSYKTRVVSAGVFDAPPAVIKLTNDPSIWASTRADQLHIDGKHALEVSAASNDLSKTTGPLKGIKWSLIVDGILIGLGVLLGGLMLTQRARITQFIQNLRQPRDIPPPPTPLP